MVRSALLVADLLPLAQSMPYWSLTLHASTHSSSVGVPTPRPNCRKHWPCQRQITELRRIGEFVHRPSETSAGWGPDFQRYGRDDVSG